MYIGSLGSALGWCSEMEFPTPLLSLAWRFPAAAKGLWQTQQQCAEWLSSLSPETRKRLRSVGNSALGIADTAARTAHSAYASVLSYPNIPPTEWTQPSGLILSPLARLILLLQPVACEGDAGSGDGKVIYLGNGAVYGLNIPAVHAAIYMKTGKLPRFFIDARHYNVPVWKHILEYFGAVPHLHVRPADILGAGSPVACLSFAEENPPAEQRGQLLKVGTVSSTCLFERELINVAMEHGFAIAPLTTIGMSEMIHIPYRVPLRPLATAGKFASIVIPAKLFPVSPQTLAAAQDVTFPIVIPTSYQRQYLRFGAPIRTDKSYRAMLENELHLSMQLVSQQQHPSKTSFTPLAMPSNDVLVEFLYRRVRLVHTLSLNDLDDLRALDPNRYILAPVYRALGYTGEYLNHAQRRLGGSNRLVRRQSARMLRGLAHWVDTHDHYRASDEDNSRLLEAPPSSHNDSDLALSYDEEWYECDSDTTLQNC